MRICLGPGGSSENCPWSEYVRTPGDVGGNIIQFTDRIGDVENPFSFTVTSLVSHSPFASSYDVVFQLYRVSSTKNVWGSARGYIPLQSGQVDCHVHKPYILIHDRLKIDIFILFSV